MYTKTGWYQIEAGLHYAHLNGLVFKAGYDKGAKRPVYRSEPNGAKSRIFGYLRDAKLDVEARGKPATTGAKK